jgi:DNA topoisomerase III
MASPHGTQAPPTRGVRAPTPPDQISRLLREVFGLQGFRPHQEAVCQAVTRGRSGLLVMPTGAGKSLCYQLPGVARGGTTLVISPLIALMEDQVAMLKAQGLRAERIHSGRDRLASRQVCRDYLDGELDFLFVAPERLGVPRFPELIGSRPLALIAVDEAHCISHWGHDFRPDYRLLKERLPPLGEAPVIALTATATVRVQDDIIDQLGLVEPERFIHGFRRSNLAVELLEVSTPERPEAVARVLASEGRRPAIVYAPTRKATEELASRLSRDFPAVAYHAGLSPSRRDEAQQAFVDGEAQVVVATIAFGMGIDKADVRSVIHTALPASVESYYQEIGRAGRDGLRSAVVLLYGYGDRRTHEWFMERDYPEVSELDRVFDALTDAPCPKDDLAAELGMDGDLLERALDKLWVHGGALIDPEENVSRGAGGWRRPYLEQVENRRDQLRQMIAFTERPGCRMVSLVKHFGDREDHGEACGLCDVCEPDDTVSGLLRPPEGIELTRISSLIDALREWDDQSVGRLYRDHLEGAMERRAFEDLLGALVRAGLIELAEAVFEKDGKAIPYRRAALTPLAFREIDLDALIRARVRLAGPPPSAARPPRPARRRRAPTPDPLVEAAQASPELVDALKAWRLQEARKRGRPAFRILRDKVLVGIAAAQPTSEEELLEVMGVGTTVLKKYGARILEVVRQSLR